MKTSFDQQIKDVWETGEFPYNPDNWERMKNRKAAPPSSQSAPRKWAMWAAIPWKRTLAAAAVLGVVVTSYFMNRTPTNPKNSSTVAISPVHIEPKSSKPILTHSSPSTITTNSPSTSTTLSSTVRSSTIRPRTKSSFNVVPNNSLTKSMLPIPKPYPSTINSTSDIRETIVAVLDHSKQKTNDTIVSHPTEVIAKQGEELRNTIPPSIDMDFAPKSQTRVRSGFGVMGGVGMGSQNAAYTAGVQYTSAVSKRLFVNSALSFSSSSIQDVAMFQPRDASTLSAQYGNSTGGLVPETFDAKTVDVKLQSMNYAHLNFNPSIGWQLSSLISLKAGFDVQQQLTNTKELSYISKDNLYRPLPATDFGLTPQVGIRLTPHIQSSLLYRKGINRMIFKKDYYDRNYLQVQLGYTF
jgi:hypothetical protein